MILLHKTLFNIEGLGRELYPELDLWKTAHPVLKKWMADRVGPAAIISDIRENLPELREAMRELPAAIRHLAAQAKSDNISGRKQAAEIQQLRDELKRQGKQRFWLTIAATAAIVAAIVFSV